MVSECVDMEREYEVAGRVRVRLAREAWRVFPQVDIIYIYMQKHIRPYDVSQLRKKIES